MDLFIIIFSQFEQLKALVEKAFDATISAEKDFPKQFETESDTVQLLKLNKHYALVSNIDIIMDNEAICSPFYFASGETLILSMESTSGMLAFDFFQHNQKIREWREIEGEVVKNTGNPLACEPENLFTSDEDEDGERDEWQLIAIAEKHCGIEWEYWGVEL